MTEVTVFFRDIPWKQSEDNHLDIPLKPAEEKSDIISERDAKNLEQLEMCLYELRSKSKEEGRKITYDNPTLEDFMDDFVLMLNNIREKRNIKDYISYYMGARFGVDVSVKFVE